MRTATGYITGNVSSTGSDGKAEPAKGNLLFASCHNGEGVTGFLQLATVLIVEPQTAQCSRLTGHTTMNMV